MKVLEKKSVKIFAVALLTVLTFGCVQESSDNVGARPDDAADVKAVVWKSKDNGTAVTFKIEDGLKLTKDMGFGWNLGNTFDATGGDKLNAGLGTETYWGQPKTTKAMIDGLVKSGIKTIRIPVSWHNHIVDVDTYELDSEWMSRVKQVVDWAIADGMYVVINIHHDNASYSQKKMKAGDGFYPLKKDAVESKLFLTNVWGQVSATFNNSYDEHLIFETLNEPRLQNDPKGHEWWYDNKCESCRESMECLNEYNQIIVDTIRKSGGNNAKRFIAVPSLACSPGASLNADFKMPADSAEGKLIAAVHMYTPYNFAMASPGDIKFTNAHKNDISGNLNSLYKKFVANGVPVYVGEMGAVDKNNLEEREAWFEYFVSNAMEKNIPCMLWDNGAVLPNGSKDYNEKFGYYKRTVQEWYFPSLIKIAVKAAK